MPFLDTPAGRLFYTDDGDGPACILIHSLGLSSAMWRSTVARLRDRRRVLAIDCRAHGRSTAERFSFDGVVDDLERLRSEEHTSELQSLMRISYAVFCLKKNKKKQPQT